MVKIFDRLIYLFYPKRCACCTVLIDTDAHICSNCRTDLKYVPTPICQKCGQTAALCECRSNRYCFLGCVAPFYHEGAAKQGVYQLKFGGRADCAEFFGTEMAKAVRREFPHINFDCACFVPMTFKNKLKRGTNQAQLLARRVASELNMPLYNNALVKLKQNKVQHNLSRNERIINVKGVFSAGDDDIKGKTVLLVDDIKTTGATLNECSRVLLNAGAKQVFCVTAVINRYGG